MDNNLFLVAVQSSLILGLVHGINPCGHSWLIIAPFVSGEKDGWRVFSLTGSFIAGIALACLLIGLTLGVISLNLSGNIREWADLITNIAIIVLGLVLIVKPELLHSHSHDHSHDHHHCQDAAHMRTEGECYAQSHKYLNCQSSKKKSHFKKATGASLFVIGFVNMIIPCPTVAIMYSYALESGSPLLSTFVFGLYAITTGIAISAVIFSIFKVSSLVRKLKQDWIEGAIMRGIGALTIFFGLYSIYAGG